MPILCARFKYGGVQTVELMAPFGQPALSVPRPALGLIDATGYGHPRVSLAAFCQAADRSKPTVKGYLRELTDHGLVLHAGYDDYAIPRRITFGQLLVEPSSYRRSLLLYQDILSLRGERNWAFACLPIRRNLNVAINRAIPVLTPDERLKNRSHPPYPEVMWYRLSTNEVSEQPVPSGEPDASQAGSRDTVPTLNPQIGLALLTATLDPRFVEASKQACAPLTIAYDQVLSQARRLYPESPPIKAIHPNTVVFPEWLRGFWETASRQHSMAVLDQPPGDPEGLSGGYDDETHA